MESHCKRNGRLLDPYRFILMVAASSILAEMIKYRLSSGVTGK